MDTRYLYEVRPVRPINIGGKSIRRPCSMQLTKSEVLEFMKFASIYRRFSNVNMEPIKVTGENLNSLHQLIYNPNYKSIDVVPAVAVVIPSNQQEDKYEQDQIEEKPEETLEDKVEESEETEEKKLKEEESSVISSESVVEDKPSYEETSETVDDDKKEDIDAVIETESDSSSEPEKNNTTINSGSGVAQFNIKGNKNNHNKNGKNNYKK